MDTPEAEAPVAESFGEALRRWRGERSLRDVAELASCGKSLISYLEQGIRQPTAQTARALDDALGAGGELVALAGARPGQTPIEQADALQAGLHELLAAGPLADSSLDEIEWTIARHGRATRYRPEGQHFPELLADFQDLRVLLSHRHRPQVRRRLLVAAARMSGLTALTLLKLGDERATSWWRTARTAAASAEDRTTLSWAYAHEAYQLYYTGDLYGALELSVRAQQLAGGLPCVGPALAAPLEARAHARLGDGEATARALEAAQTALGRLPEDEQIGSAFGYSESQLRFHAGNALTHLGQTGRAREELSRAAELYPATERMDRALVELDTAMCTVADGDPATAADQVTRTLVGLQQEHRTALIIYRAQEVADTVPPGARGVHEVRALREILALPPGEMERTRGDQHGDGR
ncbi:helix-turn-helix domain-containing protein [Streptomyces sp. NBC_00483]|uniref:helix-turn-helix domain-containing protein n=1 Tax=Streptomyces sp. NBC_00483 TaxID=2975756 RepID=UPI002E1929B6